MGGPTASVLGRTAAYFLRTDIGFEGMIGSINDLSFWHAEIPSSCDSATNIPRRDTDGRWDGYGGEASIDCRRPACQSHRGDLRGRYCLAYLLDELRGLRESLWEVPLEAPEDAARKDVDIILKFAEAELALRDSRTLSLAPRLIE